MSLVENINNYYASLSSSGIFFFWLVVVLLLALLFLTINLVIKNKELKKILKNELTKENKEDLPIIADNQTVTENVVDNIIEEEIKEKIIEEDTSYETGPYTKNVLREIETRDQTSPIKIQRRFDELNNYNNTINITKTLAEEKKNTYIEEVKESLDNVIDPEPIELTDYEKKQEEEAIISYQELLQAKDKYYNIEDDEDIDNFIDNLKEFRANL